jgi:hypothetical protein
MNIFKDHLHKEISGKQLNEYNVKFYKFINEEKCHHGLNFDVGDIIDPIEFNPTNECSKGGIYFTTFDHIFNFLDYGCYFCEILISDDSRCYIEYSKIKANKITIKNMINISDLDILDNTEYCSEIVKQNGYVIQHVKEQTEEICLEAVKQYGDSLKHVKKQTEEICFEAVKQHGYALKYVKEQTEQICLEAVKCYGDTLQYVEKQTEEICLEAVKQYGDALQYVEKQTKNMFRSCQTIWMFFTIC